MSRVHTVLAYKDYCRNMEIEVPLSDSSLWIILKEIKPSQQCSLAGLDDVACYGMNGITIFQEIVKKTNLSSHNQRETVNDLEKAKRYLEIGYPLHCKEKSSVGMHGVLCVLFNPQDKDFNENLIRTTIICAKIVLN